MHDEEKLSVPGRGKCSRGKMHSPIPVTCGKGETAHRKKLKGKGIPYKVG